jgi:hypothetical protein
MSSCGSSAVLWRISENEGLGDRAASYRGSADALLPRENLDRFTGGKVERTTARGRGDYGS